MKVYILFFQWYDTAQIMAVYAKREDAEAGRDKLIATKRYGNGELDIQEFIVL